MVREGIWIPGIHVAISAIRRLGWPGEADCVIAAHCENATSNERMVADFS
jgi:hypothetical protein